MTDIGNNDVSDDTKFHKIEVDPAFKTMVGEFIITYFSFVSF